MLRAEARRPGTFASIVAHEPIFVVPDDALPRGTAKTPLAEAAARRRRRFASREAALAAFASKPPLDALHPDGDAVEGSRSGRCVRGEGDAPLANLRPPGLHHLAHRAGTGITRRGRHRHLQF